MNTVDSPDTLMPIFSDKGLIHLLTVGVYFLKKAKRFELVSCLYNIFTPTLARQRDFSALAHATDDMHTCYVNILEIEKTKKRHLGKYYRVAFYGAVFKELDGKEFIYKEPDVSRSSIGAC